MKRLHLYFAFACTSALIAVALQSAHSMSASDPTLAFGHDAVLPLPATQPGGQSSSKASANRPEWSAPGSWTPPTTLVVDAEDGTRYREEEMRNSGCESIEGTKILIEDRWTGISDLLSGSDAVAIVRAGKLSSGEQNGPLIVELSVEEIVWTRGRIAVPKIVLAGTHAGALPASGKYACDAPLPRQSRRYLAFLFEVDGQWWTSSASEGVYEIRGKRLMRLNGGKRGPWLPIESLDETKRFVGKQPIPQDINEASRGLPKLPPTSTPSESSQRKESTPIPTTLG